MKGNFITINQTIINVNEIDCIIYDKEEDCLKVGLSHSGFLKLYNNFDDKIGRDTS